TGFLIGRVRRLPAGIAGSRHPDPRHLPQKPLGSPEAAHAEIDGLEAVRIGPLQGMSGDEMLGGGRNGDVAARKRLAHGGELQFSVQHVAQEKHLWSFPMKFYACAYIAAGPRN